MFTGLITHKGIVKDVRKTSEGMKCSMALPGLKLQRGASVAVNGTCLTVVARKGNIYSFVIMPETIRATALASLAKNREVNIELPLRYGKRLDGHFVLGHVDTKATLVRSERHAKATELKLKFPVRFQKYVAPKGSVAVDGTSLTIAATGRGWLAVALTPYTLKHTTLGKIGVGHEVNIEFDIFAKYIYESHKRKN